MSCVQVSAFGSWQKRLVLCKATGFCAVRSINIKLRDLFPIRKRVRAQFACKLTCAVDWTK